MIGHFLRLTLIGLVLTSGTSCTKLFRQDVRVYIENEAREGRNLSVKQVQYYNDRKIVLKREMRMEEMQPKISRGKLSIEDGKRIFYITIPKKTKGVCVKESGATGLDISFDEQDSQFLTFYSANPEYYLLGANSNFIQHNSPVMYDGEVYKVIDGHNARLLYRKQSKYKEKKEGHRVKGRSVK